ncbi:MAG: DUF5666 domain-containing protein [Gammaproteobacteria bacterium]
MSVEKLTYGLIGALAVASLSACSDSDTAGVATETTPTGSTVVGAVAGFGSIILNNGIEYNTDNVTQCDLDDADIAGKCEDSMAVGMNISMQLDDSGAVSSIHYDDDLEGPASAISGADGNFSFNVFGIEVSTSTPGTQWKDFTSSPPQASELDGAIVEVSGEWQGSVLVASYVERQSDSDDSYEIKGTVGTVESTSFTLALKDGSTIDVDASNANLIPQNGDYIEVEGMLDGTQLIAIRIELEDADDFDEDGEAEITGTLAQDDTSTTGYSIASTDVDISSALGCNELVGSMVEAEGIYDQNTAVLVVEKCEDEEDELEMKCLVSEVSVDPLLPKVGTLSCAFPNTSGAPLSIEFRDSPELAQFSDDDSIDPFDLTDINSGDCVEIKASLDASGALVAGLLELEEIASGCESYELKGPVDAITTDAITVLGTTFGLNGGTSMPVPAPVPGDTVEIIDTDADGTADSVEIDESETSDGTVDNADSVES